MVQLLFDLNLEVICNALSPEAVFVGIVHGVHQDILD